MGDFDGHPFRGNQWTQGQSAAMDRMHDRAAQSNSEKASEQRWVERQTYTAYNSKGERVRVSIPGADPSERGPSARGSSSLFKAYDKEGREVKVTIPGASVSRGDYRARAEREVEGAKTRAEKERAILGYYKGRKR